MNLCASNGEIVKWKLTEVEERIFGVEIVVGVVSTKKGSENEGVPTILYRIQHTLYWR